MKLVVSNFGTYGDIAPSLAIGLEAKRRGHEVLAILPAEYAALAQRLGIGYVAQGGASLRQTIGRLDRGRSSDMDLMQALRGHIDVVFDQYVEACRGADVLVHGMAELGAPSVASHLGIPTYRLCYAPIIRGDAAPPFLPIVPERAWVNRLLWALATHGTDRMMRPALNARRTRLGLAPIKLVQDHMDSVSHTLLGISEQISPRHPSWRTPFDYVGYCHLDLDDALPADLEDFLAKGDRPIYVGFGSMTHGDPAKLTRMVLEAKRRVGCRLVVGRGWSGLGEHDALAGVLAVGECAHHRLFPQMAAVVHHGGAGTTHTVARAGVPQAIVPHIGDQTFWGSRVQKLGLGPAAMPQQKLSVDRLAATFRALLDDSSAHHTARSMGERLRGENGPSNVLDLIESRASLPN